MRHAKSVSASVDHPGIPESDVQVVLRAARAFSAVVAASLAQSGDAVTWPQLRALVLVAARPDVTLTSVATGLDVHLSSASRLCDRLVSAGFLERRTSPSDRRNLLLSLTAKGSELVGRIMDHRRGTLTEILLAMEPSDRATLIPSLAAFADAAGEPGAGTLQRT